MLFRLRSFVDVRTTTYYTNLSSIGRKQRETAWALVTPSPPQRRVYLGKTVTLRSGSGPHVPTQHRVSLWDSPVSTLGRESTWCLQINVVFVDSLWGRSGYEQVPDPSGAVRLLTGNDGRTPVEVRRHVRGSEGERSARGSTGREE